MKTKCSDLCRPEGNLHWILHLVLAGLLLVITWSAFNNVLENDFIDFDDTEYILDNPFVKKGLTQESTVWSFTHIFMGNWHPLALISHMLDVELFGLHPAGHHLTSLLIHIITVFLLFEWLRVYARSIWPAAVTAALFAVHPLRVESVAWAAERKDVLCGLFGILTLWAYAYYIKKESVPRYAAVVFFFVLGLMAKGMLITWPAVLLLLDLWPLGRFSLRRPDTASSPLSCSGNRRSLTFLLLEKVPLFILAVLFSLLLYIAQQKGGAVTDRMACPLLMRAENAAISYFRYLGKMIYPAQLSVLYPFRPGYHPLPFLAALSGLLGISTLAVLQIRNRPWFFVGWFWYLVILLPVIGLIQIGRQSIADRYTYLPSIGIGIGIVWTVREWIGGRAARKHLAGWAAVIAIGAFVFGTWIQTYRWRNTLTLFEHSIRVTGDNPTLEVNLAYRLSEIGDLDRAIGMTESVLERHPSLYQAAVNLGSFYLQQKNYEASLDRLERALSIHNEHRHEILGYIGTVYKRQGNLETAVQYYRQSLDINPHNPTAFNEMGEIRNSQGSVAEAIDFWQRSLEADPHYLPALQNLAWTLSTSTEDSLRRPEQGLRYAQQALRSSGTLSVKALDILAAAYAACGNFQDAVSCAEQAIRLLPQDHNQEIKIALEKRLQLYKSGQPYREEFSLDNKQE